MPEGSNNPFGIKAVGSQPFVEAWTHETVHGKDVQVRAKFRKFGSINEAFVEHARLLANAGPYAHARTFLNDPDAFARALTGVYATADNYGDGLVNEMKALNLYQYDVRPKKQDTAPAPITEKTLPPQPEPTEERLKSIWNQ